VREASATSPAARPDVPRPAPGATASLADFLEGAATLNRGAKRAAEPARGAAHVVRIATYKGDQLIGGYTLVVAGKE
jgi:hypothetical protein